MKKVSAHRINYGTGPHQFGDLRIPDSPGSHPVVVVIHGGFWRAAYDLGHLNPFCQALTDQGWATWSIEYRRLGNPGGGWPGTFQDVGNAVDHLRAIATKEPIDLDRVVVIGHSAGGHLALWVAARHRLDASHELVDGIPLTVHGVVSLAGVSDLKWAYERRLGNGVVGDLLGGGPVDVPDRFAAASPAELLPLGVPQIFVHGTADNSVPIDISRHYRSAALATGDDVELIELSQAGHFELIDPSSHEWSSVSEAVARLLN